MLRTHPLLIGYEGVAPRAGKPHRLDILQEQVEVKLPRRTAVIPGGHHRPDVSEMFVREAGNSTGVPGRRGEGDGHTDPLQAQQAAEKADVAAQPAAAVFRDDVDCWYQSGKSSCVLMTPL